MLPVFLCSFRVAILDFKMATMLVLVVFVISISFYVLPGYRLQKSDNMPDGIYRLMRHCWDERPEKRPLFREILQDLEKIYNAL